MRNTLPPLTKQQIAAIKTVLPRHSRTPILQNILVKEGVLRVTNLDCDLSLKTDLPDGLYRPSILDNINIQSPFDAVAFPITKREPDAQWQVKMPVAELYEALAFVYPSISPEETRYYLNGVCFHEDSIVATNGHTLHKIKTAHKFSEKLDSILPTIAVKTFLKAAKNTKGDVTITKTTSRFSITSEDIVINCKAIDGAFPDYQRIIPNIGATQSFSFDSANYAEMAKIFSKHPNKRDFRTIFEGNTAVFSEKENPIEFLCADIYPLKIGLNYKYLASSGIKGTGYIQNANSPMRVDSEDGNKLFIIMPIRI